MPEQHRLAVPSLDGGLAGAAEGPEVVADEGMPGYIVGPVDPGFQHNAPYAIGGHGPQFPAQGEESEQSRLEGHKTAAPGLAVGGRHFQQSILQQQGPFPDPVGLGGSQAREIPDGKVAADIGILGIGTLEDGPNLVWGVNLNRPLLAALGKLDVCRGVSRKPLAADGPLKQRPEVFQIASTGANGSAARVEPSLDRLGRDLGNVQLASALHPVGKAGAKLADVAIGAAGPGPGEKVVPNQLAQEDAGFRTKIARIVCPGGGGWLGCVTERSLSWKVLEGLGGRS